MSEAKPQQEPSMEEILASIRRIISEDGEQGAPAAKPAEAKAGSEEDVLELTQVADEEAAAPAPEPEPEPEPEPVEEEPIAAFAEEEAELPGPPEEPDEDALPRENDEIELREEARLAAAAAAARSEGSALISDDPAAVATSSLSSLVAAVDQAHAGTPIGQAGRTIEDLVKEVLRPMIREWLDANLPGLVERLVAREIARLGRHAEGDD